MSTIILLVCTYTGLIFLALTIVISPALAQALSLVFFLAKYRANLKEKVIDNEVI